MSDRIYTTVFCDLVRQEITGKHILIGAYGSDLVPAVLPQTVGLSVWVNFVPIPTGRHTFEIVLRTEQGNESSVTGEGDFPPPPHGESGLTFAVGPMPVQIQKAGDDVTAFFRLDQEEREEIGRLKILAVGGAPAAA